MLRSLINNECHLDRLERFGAQRTEVPICPLIAKPEARSPN
jgi:hypothetical protein